MRSYLENAIVTQTSLIKAHKLSYLWVQPVDNSSQPQRELLWYGEFFTNLVGRAVTLEEKEGLVFSTQRMTDSEGKVYKTRRMKWRKQIDLDERIQGEPTVLERTIQGVPGRVVFDSDGFYLGFVNTNSTRFGGLIPGPEGMIVGVLLRDGTLQNPDGTRSKYTDPVEYLLETVEPIRTEEYHISKLTRRD